jgi:hypothetical protein
VTLGGSFVISAILLPRRCRHSTAAWSLTTMYYYISFLRPPSTHISPAAKRIVITPQVANDLRTELYYAEVDLYLSWMPCFQSASSVSAQATRPTKLTTWKPSSAYKEIPVMLPPGLRNGQSWRMVLTADATGGSRIPLLESSCGFLPFPVSSMPILFASTTHERPHKQESIQRMICLAPSLGLGQPPLSVILTEQTSFDLDKVGRLSHARTVHIMEHAS